MDSLSIDAFTPAIAMLEALHERQVSAVELLDLHLRRIERYNPTLNVIVTFDVEHARHAANAADEARAWGEHGSLLGLPVTINDTIDFKGLPGTAGVERYKDRRPEHDAPLVTRVRAAGAVIIGKTNVPPYAGDWQSANPVFGRTHNPWELSRTPDGGAAALSADLTPLEFGSDIGGSIRIPAAFCGVFGHKPSETAVTRSGHFPGTPLPNAATVLSVLLGRWHETRTTSNWPLTSLPGQRLAKAPPGICGSLLLVTNGLMPFAWPCCHHCPGCRSTPNSWLHRKRVSTRCAPPDAMSRPLHLRVSVTLATGMNCISNCCLS